ncbi:MAG: hypothetical protein GY851_15890 [bacterium]|nr:hypothetical protein [bacterium]
MPCCCLLVVMLFLPRVALVFMYLGGYSRGAFETHLWPILGFFAMPYTTCAYAIGMVEAGGFHGWTLVLLIIGVVLDLGGHGGSAYKKKNPEWERGGGR